METTNPAEKSLLAKAMNWTSDLLKGMESGEEMSIAAVKVRDKNLLTDCIKQYIDWYGGFEFSKDFTRFKKLIPVNWQELKTNITQNGFTTIKS